MPRGKAAGERCIQLDAHWQCRIFDHPERPSVCASLMPSPDMCGDHREQALHILSRLEADTAPGVMIIAATAL